MIKRKKIIRVKRNPADFDDIFFVIDLQSDINSALELGTFNLLTNLIVLYRQNHECEDCEKRYDYCECDKCDDCEQKRCVCRFLGDDSKPKDRIRIRKIVWEFIRYINNKHPDFRYKYSTHDSSSIKYFMAVKQITRSEFDFLKNLKPSSKFPKYTSLMKRLFEID